MSEPTDESAQEELFRAECEARRQADPISQDEFVAQEKLFWSLWNFCRNGDWSSLDEYLAQGGDLEVCHPTSALSLLHLACQHGDREVISGLVERGADVNSRYCGQPALHVALGSDMQAQAWPASEDYSCERYPLTTSRLLVSLGAKPQLRDQRGWTARDFVSRMHPKLLAVFDGYFNP